MPDPRQLQVGDRVRFVSLPEEWSRPGWRIHDESMDFMKALIARGRSARVARIADDGYPWIAARLRDAEGALVHHECGIYDETGWVRVEPR